MTPNQRTSKLILEIADVRRHSSLSKGNFTANDYQRLLSLHGIAIDAGQLAIILQQLLDQKLLEGSKNMALLDELVITDKGAGHLQWLKKQALAEAEGELGESASFACGPFDAEISEEALDGWWDTSDVEIKIQAFNAFYKPFKAEA